MKVPRIESVVKASKCALLLSGLLVLSGCSTLGRKAPVVPAPVRPPVSKTSSYWKADGVVGAPLIVIGLKEQRAYFFRGETLVGESPISSGKKGFETPVGSFKVLQKDAKHFSNLYGDFLDETQVVIKKNVDMSKEKVPEGATFQGASMPHFLRFVGGYGLHAGKVPGYRASHGCVRLPRLMARHFFENAEVGTPVIVQDVPVFEEEPAVAKR